MGRDRRRARREASVPRRSTPGATSRPEHTHTHTHTHTIDGSSTEEEIREELDRLLRILAETFDRDAIPAAGSLVLGRRSDSGVQLSVVVTRVPEKPLTVQQRRVAALVGRGTGNAGIARTLDISPSTVAKHLDRIYKKLGIHTREELACWAAVVLADAVAVGATVERGTI